jgi:ubiquinone biosynthesis protein
MATARRLRAVGRGALASTVIGRAMLGARVDAARRGTHLATVEAIALREAFERLGPAFVKLGQLVSVRPDVFAPELVFELSKLQDDVPAGPFASIAGVVEAEFGRPPDKLFTSFDEEPLAAGSVAQVHRARTADGRDVIVKVQRPEAAELLSVDLDVARAVAWDAGRLGVLAGIDAPALVDEFQASVARELDFRVEAANADRFSFLFRGDPDIRIPEVVWERTSRRLLTMERIEGWPLSEVDQARAAGMDTQRLARAGARAFMEQVLVFGIFHADLHPANLMIASDGRVAYLDFGIVGRLSQGDMKMIARLLAAITGRDTQAALAAAACLGVRIPPDRLDPLAAEVSRLIDRHLGDGERVGLGEFGKDFLAALRSNRVAVPTGFGLLVKALVTVEGVSQTLAPEVDLVATARPVATLLMMRQTLGDTLGGQLAWGVLRGVSRRRS